MTDKVLYADDREFATPDISEISAGPGVAYGSEMARAIAADAAAAVRGATDSRLAPPQKDHPKGHAHWLAWWRMCSDPDCLIGGHLARSGWITVGPGLRSRKGEEECADFAKLKHATRLEKYQEFSNYEGDGERYAPLQRIPDFWIKHRLGFGQFTWLVRQEGGLMEFPVEQIRQYRWHVSPSTAEIIRKFRPDALVEPDFPCHFGCVIPPFPSEDQYKRHVSAVHAEKSEMVALAEQMRVPLDAMKDAFANGQADSSLVQQAILQMAQTNQMITTLLGSQAAPEQFPTGAVAQTPRRSRREPALLPDEEAEEIR